MFRRFRPILLILALISILSACGKSPEVIHILTDRRELASAVEIYDTAVDDVILTIRHVDAIDAATIDTGDFDVIIGTHLNAESIIGKMKLLDVDSKTYGVLIGSEDTGFRSPLLPLSFGLPLVMGLETSMDLLPDDASVRPEELMEAGDVLKQTDSEGRPTALAFSPSWDPLTFVDLLMARDPSILGSDLAGIPPERLEPIVAEAGAWILASTGGSAADSIFNEKYRYAPDQRLLLDRRILFSRTDMHSWNALPDAISDNMDIRYFRGERNIPVTFIVSAAIPRASGRSVRAEAFLSWLTESGTQEILMDRWERDGIDVFGYFGGLSANPEVNTGILPDRYPEMNGMIPESHYLSVPAALPDRWQRIRDEVLAPWLAAAAAAEADRLAGLEVSPVPTLAETYRKWDLSSLDESD